MSETQLHSKCLCRQCGGHIEFPSQGVGMWIHCPHCGEKTQLVAPPPIPSVTSTAPVPRKPKSSRRTLFIVVGIIAGLVIVGVGAVLLIGFKIEQHREARRAVVIHQVPPPSDATPKVEQQPDADLWKGLKPSGVSIESSPKSRLVYAVGTIKNNTDKQRFGVKVTLDILDKQGEKLGTTTDYTQFIDAHKDWSFKALVAYPKAKTAKVTAISEE
jgi:hypothetical protein